MNQYVLSLSYGKDSLACLGAIEKLGLPLDRIVHAEVWATDTIPADLPPMIEFKRKADGIIKERWGIEVEHIYATKKVLLTNCSCRERERDESTPERATGSISNETAQDKQDSEIRKLTYEDIFYRERTVRRGENRNAMDSRSSGDSGATDSSREMSSSDYRLCDKMEPILHGRTQKNLFYGFPISVKRGNWCTRLKQKVF